MININKQNPHIGKILDKIPQEQDLFDQFHLRQRFIDDGMYAFVSWKWVKPLAQFIGHKKCLEIMAGRGWLSLALQHCGVNIVATDDHSWSNKGISLQNQVTRVLNMNAVNAIRKYGEQVEYVILSWPPYQSNDAFKSLSTMNIINPNLKMIYIGEGYGGCTGDDEFIEHFNIIEDDKFDIVSNNFESWYGIHDKIMLGRYAK